MGRAANGREIKITARHPYAGEGRLYAALPVSRLGLAKTLTAIAWLRICHFTRPMKASGVIATLE
jgi:hypothetical protein